MSTLLPFILFQDLHASPLQITLLVSLKPIVSLLSIYWSTYIHNRPDRLKRHVMRSTSLGLIPFFFFPFVENSWFVIFAATVNILFERGAKPAWMELLHRHLNAQESQKIFSFVSTCSYLVAGILPLFFGFLMDHYPSIWRWIFPSVALLSLSSLYFQAKLPRQEPLPLQEKPKKTIAKGLLSPWLVSFNLLRKKPSFFLFQMGFFLGGSAIMMVHPILPKYFMEELHLSYTKLALALTLCKGIGFSLTSFRFAKALHTGNLFFFAGIIPLIMGLQSLLLLSASWFTNLVYVAYLIYGVMQAGSELVWHMSGPLFAKGEDSSLYTSINIQMVGIRGLFAPACGTWLMTTFGVASPLCLATFLCFVSALMMWLVYTRSAMALAETTK